MITTTEPREQQALLLTTTKPLLHLTTAKRYPHAVGALEARGRTVQISFIATGATSSFAKARARPPNSVS